MNKEKECICEIKTKFHHLEVCPQFPNNAKKGIIVIKDNKELRKIKKHYSDVQKIHTVENLKNRENYEKRYLQKLDAENFNVEIVSTPNVNNFWKDFQELLHKDIGLKKVTELLKEITP